MNLLGAKARKRSGAGLVLRQHIEALMAGVSLYFELTANMDHVETVSSIHLVSDLNDSIN